MGLIGVRGRKCNPNCNPQRIRPFSVAGKGLISGGAA